MDNSTTTYKEENYRTRLINYSEIVSGDQNSVLKSTDSL